MSKQNVQPAVKSYFFGDGYKELWNTIVESFKANWESAKTFGKKAKEVSQEARDSGKWRYIYAAGIGFAALSVLVFGTIVIAALSAAHVSILGLFFLFIYLSFTILWGVDKLYRIKNKIFVACPTCHHKSEIPIYYCPKCREAHTNLIPSKYGIVKRTCNCGEKLPTTFLNGRGKLEAQCPSPECKTEIKAAEATPICIPIIGGPSVGKTCYLFAATRELIEKTAPGKGWKTPFPDQQNQDLYTRATSNFENGVAPLKTSKETPVAFNFFINSDKWKPDKIIYLYDAAGEHFHESRELLSHGFYQFIHGFIFIIDPFSIPQLLHEYDDKMKLQGNELKASLTMLEDTFDRVLINLEKNHKIKRDQQISNPCAIVINKIDAFDLEDRIGHKAAKDYFARHPEIKDIDEARNMLCKEQFKTWGLGNFMRKVDQKFKNYQFYTCSALGRMLKPENEYKNFEPYRVVDPLLWVLGEANKDLKR